MLSLALSLLFAAPGPIDLATASPNAAALEVGWRDGIRAKTGGRIRLIDNGEDEEGGLFNFSGFIELHNQSGYYGLIPFEFWRGRFMFEGGYRLKIDGPRPLVFRLTAAVEHESDHPTAPGSYGYGAYSGFVNLNSVALQAALRRGGAAPTHLSLTLRLHLLTCTYDPVYCGAGGGSYGDRGFEVEAAATQELALWGWLKKWNLFAALWGQATVGTLLIQPAARVSFRLGAIRHGTWDGFAFFLQGLLGTDVGYFAQSQTAQLGAGIGWSPN